MAKLTGKIELNGKIVEEHNTQDGFATIEISIEEILGEINDETLVDYVLDNFDVKHVDDFQSDIDDFSEDELVEALENNYYDFLSHHSSRDEDAWIEKLEEMGYVVTMSEDSDNLDVYDKNNLDEIIQKFVNGNFDEREKIYKLISSI